MNKLYKKYANLNQNQLDASLVFACQRGKLDHVKYLLTSTELNLHAQVFYEDYNCLVAAAYRNDIEIVKYLLTSPDLKHKANIHANKDKIFTIALIHEDKTLMMFLIEEMNIVKTKYINAALKCDPNRENILKLFKARDFSNKLDAKLNTKNENVKPRIKI